jgi:hypothetical protein
MPDVRIAAVEFWEIVSIGAGWAAGTLALLAAIIGIAAIRSNKRGMKWLPAILAFLAATASFSGIYAGSIVEKLSQELRTAVPVVTADLRKSDDLGFYVRIESKDLLPFEFHYAVVTRPNILIGPILMGWEKVYPTRKQPAFAIPTQLQLERIVDSYVEFQFRYRSVYSVEQNYPEGLERQIVRKYKLLNGRLQPVTEEPTARQ